MKSFLFLFLLSVCVPKADAQDIKAFSADQVIHYTSSKDTLYIVNFWATWCVPCVHELPEFNALCKRYKNNAVKVLMVSLDFKEDYPYKLSMFVKRVGLSPEVVWLSDTDPNVFIPKIDKSWEGSVPATVIVAPGKDFKQFIEGTITERQVSKIVDKVINE